MIHLPCRKCGSATFSVTIDRPTPPATVYRYRINCTVCSRTETLLEATGRLLEIATMPGLDDKQVGLSRFPEPGGGGACVIATQYNYDEVERFTLAGEALFDDAELDD
jgi:hypothetical protein